nr:immunoglobulin heavy chain junction region [Mus musculus]
CARDDYDRGTYFDYW